MSDKLIPVSIIGVGKCLPEKVITNDDLSTIVDTNDEWISSRTGFKQRRIASGNETAATLGAKAAQDALDFAGIDGSEVDLIICANSTPDLLMPSTACEIQALLGITGAPAFSLSAACSGLVYALNTARAYISSGIYKKVLVIGSEVHSRFVDWEDRATCVLFGDGAGALLLSESLDGQNDILSVELAANGAKGPELTLPVTGAKCPLVDKEEREFNSPYMYMNGKEIYKFAVTTVPKSVRNALEIADLPIEKLDYLIPHHANMRIITAIQDRLNLEDEQIIVSLENYGNTSTASTPIAITEALSEGKLKPGSTVAICGFGGGLTWGTAIVKWRATDKRKN